jgi:long-chain acyl-CoA synthetase
MSNLTPTIGALPQILEATAARVPDSTALIYFGTRIDYSTLQLHAGRLAAGLQAMGVAKGDRVGLLLGNCPQFFIGYFGALRAGAIVTATSTMYTPREIGHQWNDAGVKVVIIDRSFLPTVKATLPLLASAPKIVITGLRQYCPRPYANLRNSLNSSGPPPTNQSSRPPDLDGIGGRDALGAVAPAEFGSRHGTVYRWAEVLRLRAIPHPVEVAGDDIACLQYTGGTTGRSKGAMLSHGNLICNAVQASERLRLGKDQSDMMVAALPLFHIYAMTCVMNSSVQIGACVVVLPRFELKAALKVIRKYRPTIFHGVPTMYVAFNNAPHVERYGFNSLRICMSGGAPLPVDVREKFEALTGGHLLEGYGLTETSPVTHINPPTGSPRVGSIGLPVQDTDARIMDLETGEQEMPIGEVGEIVIRGPQVMQGYWNRPGETSMVLRNGWLYTGDVARKDADGYFYIVDRKKDLIIAGGYNIYPREVEEVLFECPKVREAGVIGVPDSYRGETVKAFVVLKAGVVADSGEIIDFCRERLASYKVPRHVVFIDALPRSAVGKYLRRELRNLSA